ncbi:hypothetical protein HGM15179_013058, partial [Zosterops borbonicus]
ELVKALPLPFVMFSVPCPAEGSDRVALGTPGLHTSSTHNRMETYKRRHQPAEWT